MDTAPQIEYVNTLADVSALARFQLRHTRGGRLVLYGGTVAMAGLTALDLVTEDHELSVPHLVAILVTALIISLAFYLFVFLTVGPLTKAYFRYTKNKGVTGVHVLSITDGGLREDSGAGTQIARFDGLEQVAETEKYCFIFTSAVAAHIVPKLAVTRGDLGEFMGELKSRIAAAAS